MTTATPTPSNQTPTGTATPPAPPAAGQLVRHQFAGAEVATMGDINAQRAGAEARALVEARFVMARRFPRDLDDVRVRVLREVERPGFAEIAWYRKPIGAGVEGLSVRFFEAAARCMGNLMVTPTTTYEDDQKRVVRVEVIDLETNYSPSLDVTIEKTVERKALNDGRVAMSVRKNSKGEITYTVEATEDEMLGKTNSLVSKARRNLLQQIVPGDITDQAKARILAIRRGDAAKDPEAMRKKVIDSFALLNVMPSDLKRWLGHDVAQASPAELTDLRDLYSAIQSGETSWADALAEKIGAGETNGEAGAQPKPGLAGVTDRLKQQGAAGAAGPATTTAPKDCKHELAKAHLADQPIGTKVACEVCGEELTREREPGEDDEAPRVEDAKKTDKPRQGRLSEK